MPTLSVIIPTHKRADILAECLRHLERQTITDQIEVIVVSDGYDEKTSTLFKNSSWRIPVKFFAIEKSQQGSARNEGLKYAQGRYVLFIGDDIFLEREACERHLEAHEGCELSAIQYEHQLRNHAATQKAVLGFTTWDPSVDITPVMTWLEASGWQFGYSTLNRLAPRSLGEVGSRATGSGPFIPPNIQHRYTYTSHISLPLEIAKKYLFRTDMHLYGWEDIEWGMRLADAGVRLFYEPDAKALHHHRISFEESLQRMEVLGRSAAEISKKIPAFDRVPKGWKLFLYRIVSLLPTMAGRHRKAFLKGLGGKVYP